MPSKKKKYNARFPPARIKKIMQTDEEVGKVAAPVPVIISRALELFVESLLTKAVQITMARNAKTLSPAHLKQCILAESRFDFLKELVMSIPDVQGEGEEGSSSIPATPTANQPPVFRSHLASDAVSSPSSSSGRKTGGTGRPRGRPKKTVQPIQRSWSAKSGKSATESEDTDFDESEGSEDEEELSTDTDSLPKGTKNVATNNGSAVTNPQSTFQFNAVQPNFYQEINNPQPAFQIQINLPANDVSKVGNGQNKESTYDDDYDT
nr:EOG090X0H1B [Cyclestheria hislopi]